MRRNQGAAKPELLRASSGSTVYRLTGTGREELRAWLRELVEVPAHEYPQFVTALSLIAALPPSEVLQLMRTRLLRLAEQRSEIRDLIDGALADRAVQGPTTQQRQQP